MAAAIGIVQPKGTDFPALQALQLEPPKFREQRIAFLEPPGLKAIPRLLDHGRIISGDGRKSQRDSQKEYYSHNNRLI